MCVCLCVILNLYVLCIILSKQKLVRLLEGLGKSPNGLCPFFHNDFPLPSPAGVPSLFFTSSLRITCPIPVSSQVLSTHSPFILPWFPWLLQVIYKHLRILSQKPQMRESMQHYLFLGLGYLTQYNVFLVYTFASKLCDFIFFTLQACTILLLYIFSVEGNLSSFHFLVTMNRTGIKNVEELSVQQDVKSLRHMPRSDTAGSYGRYIYLYF